MKPDFLFLPHAIARDIKNIVGNALNIASNIAAFRKKIWMKKYTCSLWGSVP